MELFAGLDVSTQSSKLVIINIQTKQQVYTDAINYDKDLPHYHTINGTILTSDFGVSESNPLMWLEAIDSLFARLSKKSEIISNIKAISVSGQQHGLVTLNEEGHLSRLTSKLWNDFSTEAECEFLTTNIGGKDHMIKLIGNTQRTGYTAPKILHMIRNEPEKYAKTRWILLVHNYINWVLTGGIEGGVIAMEPGDASGTALWDPQTRTWRTELIKIIDPKLIEKLPHVLDSRKPLGKISHDFAKRYGFSPNCMIASGSGDNMMGAIGTGNIAKGIVSISLGTSGTAYTFMEDPFVDPDGEIACFCDATNHYLPLVCISNLANGYDRILQHFNISHEEFESIIQQTKPGNKGRIICPWYEGERTPDLPEAVPLYFGFMPEDFTQEILCRAILEGHCLNLYQGFQKLLIRPTEIRLTGGISQSQAWRECIANVFDCEVIPVKGEGAATGAAIHAAWTFHSDSDITDFTEAIIELDESKRTKPDSNAVIQYNNSKSLYKALSNRIQGLPAENPFKLSKLFPK